MMMCGSFLGLLLAKGFATHDLGASDISEFCGTIRMAKKTERSLKGVLPPLHGSPLRGFGDLRSSDHDRGGVASMQGTYPYQGSTGSGLTERSGWSLEAESLGSGGEPVL